jgi:hypothetical protein
VSATTTRPDLLDRVVAGTGLPTDDERGDFDTALMLAGEILDRLARRMFELIDDAGQDKIRPPEPIVVTWDNIGKLLVFVRRVQDHAENLTILARRMERATHADLTDVCQFGNTMSLPQFDRHGFSNYGSDDA